MGEKLVIVDYGRFRECVYELIENENSILNEETTEVLEQLVTLFLQGEVVLHSDTI